MTIQKVQLVLLVFILLCGVFPTPPTYAYVLADSNVSDWIKDEPNKEQDSVPTTEHEKESETAEQTSGLTAGDYIKPLFAFAFVIGLLFFLLKFVNRKNRLYDRNRLMKNMGGISLGQHKSIQLVVVGDAYYLIGVGEDIRLLKEITDPAEIERLKAFYENTDLGAAPGWLERMLVAAGRPKQRSGSTSDDSTADFSNVFNTKLAELKADRKKRIRQVTEKERNGDE